MADSNAQADIRGIDIDKLAKGFADEENVFKKYVVNSTTKAREIRWYQKTSGFLDSVDTTGITASQIANTSSKSRPVVVEQSWTRNTSYVKKYFVESPWLTDEDIKDCDIDILATNVRDLVRAVENQVDKRIYSVLTVADVGTGENARAITDEWDDYSNCIPIDDILYGKEQIRTYGYNPEGVIFAITPAVHRLLLNYLIATKGSSIPSFASAKLQSGVVMEILGCNIIVSTNVTTDKAVMFVPQRACTWKSFTPITSVSISDPGIGTKIRVWEEGEAILTDPRAVCFYSNIGPT
jgi:hypothetical protein